MTLDTSIERYVIGTNLLRDVMNVDRWRREKEEAYDTMTDEQASERQSWEASRRWEEVNNLIKKYDRLGAERRELTAQAKQCDPEDKPLVEDLVDEAYRDVVETFETVAFKGEAGEEAILSITPHEAGRGEQTPDDIATLQDMYFGWFDDQGWDVELLSESSQACKIGVEGAYALSWTKPMQGLTKIIHQDGKTYTNRYSVGVIEQAEQSEVSLDDQEVEEDFYKGSTSGGQHANTAETNVRLTHRPTDITATVTGRHRSLNRNKAYRILRSKVKEHYEEDDQRLGLQQGQLFSIDLRYPTVADDSTNSSYSGKRAKQILDGDLSETAMRRVVNNYDEP